MAKASKKQQVRMVPIPEKLYFKLEKIAKKSDASVMGITVRALYDYLESEKAKKHDNPAQD